MDTLYNLFLGHTFQITNASNPTKGSKAADVRLVFYKKKKHEVFFCGWVSGPDEVGQTDLNLPLLRRNPQKTQIQNFPIF